MHAVHNRLPAVEAKVKMPVSYVRVFVCVWGGGGVAPASNSEVFSGCSCPCVGCAVYLDLRDAEIQGLPISSACSTTLYSTVLYNAIYSATV